MTDEVVVPAHGAAGVRPEPAPGPVHGPELVPFPREGDRRPRHDADGDRVGHDAARRRARDPGSARKRGDRPRDVGEEQGLPDPAVRQLFRFRAARFGNSFQYDAVHGEPRMQPEREIDAEHGRSGDEHKDNGQHGDAIAPPPRRAHDPGGGRTIERAHLLPSRTRNGHFARAVKLIASPHAVFLLEGEIEPGRQPLAAARNVCGAVPVRPLWYYLLRNLLPLSECHPLPHRDEQISLFQLLFESLRNRLALSPGTVHYGWPGLVAASRDERVCTPSFDQLRAEP